MRRDESKTKMAKGKILVVDDDLMIRQLLSEELTDLGYDVETAENSGEAIYRLRRDDYDLILLDIRLLGMSGIKLYRVMEKTPQSLADRVIFITGDVMGEDTHKFLSDTKCSCITKPFHMAQLTKEINHILIQQA